MKFCWFLLLLVPAAITVRVKTAPEAEVLAALRMAPQANAAREALLKQQFIAQGCVKPELQQQTVSGVWTPNLICTRPGAGAGVIVVSAHSDHVTAGQGVVDNWSGAALLPLLYASLPAQPRHTFRFIAFTDEEGGLVGSHYYVEHLKRSDAVTIRAEINLDALGLGPTEVWATHSDPNLAAMLFELAGELKLPAGVVNIDQIGDEDGSSFRRHNVPVLMVHSITEKTLPILHSPQDTMAAIQADDYYGTYRLLAVYLELLDARLP